MQGSSLISYVEKLWNQKSNRYEGVLQEKVFENGKSQTNLISFFDEMAHNSRI